MLTPQQQEIMRGKVCPYCKGKTKFVDSKVIYGVSFGKIYLCEPCDAYCGVHKGTCKSLGRLANKELRKAKKEAHKYFDLLWQEKHVSRKEAYQRLSEYLNIPKEYTHIGMFGVATCQKVVEWSKMIINDLRRLDKDYGVKNVPDYLVD